MIEVISGIHLLFILRALTHVTLSLKINSWNWKWVQHPPISMVGLPLVLGNKFNQRTELCRDSLSVSAASFFTCVSHCSLTQIGFFSTVLMVKNKTTTAQRFSFLFFFSLATHWDILHYKSHIRIFCRKVTLVKFALDV